MKELEPEQQAGYTRHKKSAMASPPQTPVSILQRLPDELLQNILSLAMTRDSPVYIDDRHLGYMDGKSGRKSSLTSSTGATDSLFLGEGMRTPEGPFYADHQHDPQSVHRADWLAINSTNRRIRTVGKPCFFGAKTIAMRAELPIRLQLKDYQAKNRMSSSDQALAFMYARDIVLVNTSNISPSHLLGLPKLFTRFPCLRRCMLLFGWDEVCDDVEWISCAFVLGEPVGDEVKELMVAVGMERNMVLEEALGPCETWERHRERLTRNIYPTLRIKEGLLKEKVKREDSRG